MRPGRLTPENLAHDEMEGDGTDGFNEAGAINPGKPDPPRLPVMGHSSFNEAGAINPGKPIFQVRQKNFCWTASMRPGRLTPENRLFWKKELQKK